MASGGRALARQDCVGGTDVLHPVHARQGLK
jgi:hypothetical protein